MIVFLLVLIILLIAPWMFWWFVGAVATWALVLSVLGAAALIFWTVFRLYRAAFPPEDAASARLAAKNREFNRKCLEESRQKRERLNSTTVQGVADHESSEASPLK